MPGKKKAAKSKTARKKPVSRHREHDLQKGVEQFAEEMEKIGERFGKRCEKKGKGMESWFHSTFSIVGPLLSSIFGVIIIAVFLWVLNLVNIPLGVGLLQNIHSFLAVHIGWFFLIFMFFSYASYVSKLFPRVYRPLSPIVSAAGITVALWILASAIRIVNLSVNVELFTNMASFIEGSLGVLFYVFLLMGYLVLIAREVTGKPRPHAKEKAAEPKRVPPKTTRGLHRLYRSGNDRILGGVCGGIAEYLGVDPVIVRVLWVLFSLTWGMGILAYIIMWIIMPRNPGHKWD